jgi:hypothetical protein
MCESVSFGTVRRVGTRKGYPISLSHLPVQKPATELDEEGFDVLENWKSGSLKHFERERDETHRQSLQRRCETWTQGRTTRDSDKVQLAGTYSTAES